MAHGHKFAKLINQSITKSNLPKFLPSKITSCTVLDSHTVYIHVHVHVPAPQVLQRSESHSLTARKQGQCLVLHEERHLQPGNLLVPIKEGETHVIIMKV